MLEYIPFFIQTAIIIGVILPAMFALNKRHVRDIDAKIAEFFAEKDAREGELRARERLVIAASMESELLANKTKIEAFLLIYQELLRSLRDPGKAPKYKLGGEIVHEKPALSRNIFDAYISRLELFGPTIAGELSQLYAQIEEDPEYKTLNPEMSQDQAINMVESIVLNAKNLLEPLEKNIGALNVIIRTKKRGIVE